jgi:DNA-binding IclR family transcriptional regulator
MQAGSAAQILLAWEDAEKIRRAIINSKFTPASLAAVRRRGWAQSVGEREAGVASVSAPVRGPNNKIIAAVSISGPIERLGRQPGRLHAAAVMASAARLSEYISKK